MTATDDRVKQYKLSVGTLFLRRHIEGPLSNDEEADLAEERVDLMSTIPESEQLKLEWWIESLKKAFAVLERDAR
jgi:hypothetical protein